MRLTDFEFVLPRELIAQQPPAERGQSRMLVLSRSSGEIRHEQFSSFVDLHQPGDVVVLNDTRVFPARLLGGMRDTGGAVEIFLVRRVMERPGHWLAMAHAGGKLRIGENLRFGDSCLVELCARPEGGMWEIAFPNAEMEAESIRKYGHVPLPPYIDRPDNISDRERYQTVYSDPVKEGAVAAPTAGLHFTDEILQALTAKGVHVVRITLHVGPGTFKPVVAENIEDHRVDPEFAEITPEAARVIAEARARGGRVTAVGTTVVRTLESACRGEGASGLKPFIGLVDLYIRPGFEFRTVDRILTNFHLPKSSLLILVSAFAGRGKILSAYDKAIEKEYLFYSYGDCMFIE